jgi:hypothetical protein
MSWFQLDPRSLAERAPVNGVAPKPLSLGSSIILGSLGFCVVSIAGFIPWAIFGRELGRSLGEAGMYAVCALVFIALAGLFLHRLIMGCGSLRRFYQLFPIAMNRWNFLGRATSPRAPCFRIGALGDRALPNPSWFMVRVQF